MLNTSLFTEYIIFYDLQKDHLSALPGTYYVSKILDLRMSLKMCDLTVIILTYNEVANIDGAKMIKSIDYNLTY